MTRFASFTAGFALSAVVGVAGILPASAASCDQYALLSAKQQQENIRKQCGHSGKEWSTNIKAHKAWCASVLPNDWKKMLSTRQSKLKGGSCKG